MPKKAKYAGKIIEKKLKPLHIKAIKPPTKKAKTLPLYDFKYNGKITKIEATITENRSTNSI